MNQSFQPTSYKDIVFPSVQVTQLLDDLVTNQIPFPSHGRNGVICYGPNGTGKSTLVSLLPDAMEMVRTGQPACTPTRHVVASGNNGASLMASLANIAANVSFNFGHQFFILDEVDNLGAASMQSLKSIMDTPRSIFLMTTNHLAAIDRGVKSRSHLIDMTQPPPAAWLPRCRSILSALGASRIPSDAELLPLIVACSGDAREIVTQMHQLARMLRQSGAP